MPHQDAITARDLIAITNNINGSQQPWQVVGSPAATAMNGGLMGNRGTTADATMISEALQAFLVWRACVIGSVAIFASSILAAIQFPRVLAVVPTTDPTVNTIILGLIGLATTWVGTKYGPRITKDGLDRLVRRVNNAESAYAKEFQKRLDAEAKTKAFQEELAIAKRRVEAAEKLGRGEEE